MSAWMIDAVVQIFGRSDWLIFGAAEVCTILAILPVVLIVRERFGAKVGGYTALAAFLSHFTTLSAVEYNVNMGFLPFWGWMIYTFLKAEEKDTLLWWTLFGLISAGGMLGKYTAAIFLMSATLWVLLKRRDLLVRPGPYIAAFVFLIALSPHLVWLVKSDFVLIEYALNRTGSGDVAWYQHITMPLRYVGEFIYSVAPMLVALAIAAGWSRIKSLGSEDAIAAARLVWSDPFLFAAVGPVLVISALSLGLGANIKTVWSMPLGVVFAGCIGVAAAHLEASKSTVKQRFLISWGVIYGTLLIVFVAIMVIAPFVKKYPKRMLHDGPALARIVEDLWAKHETKPFEYLVGDHWPGGSVAWYTPSRPSFFERANLSYSPWIDVEDMQSKGAVYVDYKNPTDAISGMCVVDAQKILWPAPGGRIYKKHPEVWIAVLKPSVGPNAVECAGIKK
ncbi:glycosyltransferase family 39 protein [Pseudovibrio sp. Tun.PSC04-5.I4]|uniref:glycosyltransferase family 39 protein n=1 Tax=Pseudovibrio sp. Tun.PSC04-5.I4 TaxID=1798213 RepID=UPI0013565FA4|nr:glycosyltransferase family 39 protein [Pseudovibrio sp. Tun.PSC04-5.I4]